MDEEGARQALELDLFALVERDVVRTGDQLTHELRHQDLAALGLAGDACREDDVTTEQIAALGDGLARVQADAHPHALVRVSPGVALDLLLNGDRARQHASRAVEREHEAVALRLDLVAAVGAQLLADDLVVRPEHLHPLGVAVLLGEHRRVLDVGEHHRHRAVELAEPRHVRVFGAHA